MKPPPNPLQPVPKTAPFVVDAALRAQIKAALAEDIGSGDVTTDATVPVRAKGRALLYAKSGGIFCGGPVADAVWRLMSPSIRSEWSVAEGGRVYAGQLVAEFHGPYRALLTGERVALNLIQRMSGIATLTRRMVDLAREAAGDAAPAICDTRKTTPLWRTLDRYAVRMGGGVNHRFGLFDMVLIKENHARAAGGVGEAIRLARKAAPKIPIAAEATNADEVNEAFGQKADLVLLDNMTPTQIKRLVERFRGSGGLIELSGGVNPGNIAGYAKTGVDRISVGALTHSAPALDLSLQIHPEG